MARLGFLSRGAPGALAVEGALHTFFSNLACIVALTPCLSSMACVIILNSDKLRSTKATNDRHSPDGLLFVAGSQSPRSFVLQKAFVVTGSSRCLGSYHPNHPSAFQIITLLSWALDTPYKPLCPSSIANLDPLSGPLVIAAQHRPAGTVRLDKRQLQLGAQHAERRLLRINRSEELIGVLIALVVRGRKVEGDGSGSEVDSSTLLVNLFQVERDIDGGRGLVKVVSVDEACG